MNTDLIRAHKRFFPLLTDSGVHQSGEGYERTLIVSGWHRDQPHRMAELRIRVDRVPGKSYANTSIWTTNSGWQTVAMLDHREFWDDMPGYLRWANDNSETKTANLASRMVEDLVSLIEEQEVEV